MNQQTAGERFGIKGRRTIRKAPPGQNATGSYVGLWDIQGKPGSTVHRLERVYLSALNSVDGIEARKAEALKSGRFTPDGARADALQFAAQQLSPVFHRGKHQIAAAKLEAAELRSKVKLQPTDKTDLVCLQCCALKCVTSCDPSRKRSATHTSATMPTGLIRKWR